MRVPNVNQAEIFLKEASELNPGRWVDHCQVAAECARKIAKNCGMDGDIAYVMGLLHDIGRRVGVVGMRHMIEGYYYLMEQGFEDCARICLTHSFPCQNMGEELGKRDCTPEEETFIGTYITEIEYDDYDRLIQLSDAIALPERAVLMEKRLVDVALRYGVNDMTTQKWRKYFEIKEYFDRKAGCDIYTLIGVLV